MSVTIDAKSFYIKLKCNLDFLSVKQYYERRGWKIVYFTESSDLITKFKLLEKAKNEKAFVYKEEALKYIFVRKNLSEYEKRRAIFHEAGHIELKHEFSRLTKDAQEREADEFASVLEDCCDKKYNSRTPLLTMAVSVIIVLTALIVHHTVNTDATTPLQNNDAVQSVPAPENNGNTDFLSGIQNDVYITPSGDKYHMQNCYYIRTNDTAFAIDIDDAKKSYLPCSFCIYEQ